MTFQTLLNIHGKLDWRDLKPQLAAHGVFSDSRSVQPQSVYVAIRGHSQDGHDYLGDAIGRGAQCLVVEQSENVPASFRGAVLEVLDTRLSLQVLAQRFLASQVIR